MAERVGGAYAEFKIKLPLKEARDAKTRLPVGLAGIEI